jgi:hypothetical protein
MSIPILTASIKRLDGGYAVIQFIEQRFELFGDEFEYVSENFKPSVWYSPFGIKNRAFIPPSKEKLEYPIICNQDELPLIASWLQEMANEHENFKELRKGAELRKEQGWNKVWDGEKWNLPKMFVNVDVKPRLGELHENTIHFLSKDSLTWLQDAHTFKVVSPDDEWRYPQKELKPINPNSDKWEVIPDAPMPKTAEPITPEGVILAADEADRVEGEGMQVMIDNLEESKGYVIRHKDTERFYTGDIFDIASGNLEKAYIFKSKKDTDQAIKEIQGWNSENSKIITYEEALKEEGVKEEEPEDSRPVKILDGKEIRSCSECDHYESGLHGCKKGKHGIAVNPTVYISSLCTLEDV